MSFYMGVKLTLWEKHRWRVTENKSLRRIYGPKRAQVTEGRRTLPYIVTLVA
jgi:hypothetical protein